MTTLAPPRITGVTLSPETITAGVPILATVEWTGFPVTGVSYQWRRGSVPIDGMAGPQITPTEQWADLNCFIYIDNGRGSAMSASAYAEIPEPADEGPLAFSSGFSGGFY